jgi:hypothetical protein
MLELETSPKMLWMPCALGVVLRHSRVAKVSIREPFPASIFFVIHLRSNWRAYDDLCTGKLDFAYLREAFHGTQKLLTEVDRICLPTRRMSLPTRTNIRGWRVCTSPSDCHGLVTAGGPHRIPSTLSWSRCPLITVPSPLVRSTLSST